MGNLELGFNLNDYILSENGQAADVVRREIVTLVFINETSDKKEIETILQNISNYRTSGASLRNISNLAEKILEAKLKSNGNLNEISSTIFVQPLASN